MNPLKQMMCLAIVMLCLTGCASGGQSPSPTKNPSELVHIEPGADFVGVVRGIDDSLGTISLYNIYLDEVQEYQYSGGTEIYSKNERDMSMAEVEPVQVYDFYKATGSQKISKMIESKSIEEKKAVNVSVDSEQKRITVDGDVTYAYTDQLVVMSDNQLINPMEILTSDEVTFRGVKGQAYSLVVTRSHGYVEPTGYDDFIGGTLTLQGEAILPITKEMLLMLPEGTRRLSMVNGDLTGEVDVEVKRGQVTKVNMKMYQSQMPDTARVTFEIQPEGAELYINGKLTDYSKKIPLKYGNHSVKVVLEGYNEYKGVVTIQDAGPTVRINLVEQEAEVDSDDTDSSSNITTDSDSSSSTATTKTDSEHKITVSAPVGAAVYIDGTYKGVAPCSFDKIIGEVTLTLTKENYTTKSYSVKIVDDSKDVSWSFPDLEKSSD